MKNLHPDELLKIKRFGYVISAIMLIISNVALINNWQLTPIIFIITMYFLTGSLWGLVLIKPFYSFFDKYFLKKIRKENTNANKNIFNKN